MALPFNIKAIEKHVNAAKKLQKDTLVAVNGAKGLNVVVKKTGHASYVVRYQVGSGSARKTVKQVLGAVGVLALADAREKAEVIMREWAKGADPINKARREKADETRNLTLRQLWEKRSAEDARLVESSREKYRGYLEKNAFPTLGDKLARDVTREDIVRMLKPVAERSKITAHHVQCGLSGTYRYGMKRLWVDSNPASGAGYTHRSPARYRRVSDEEIATLWAGIEDKANGILEGTRIALKLIVLLGQRGQEIVGARFDEFELEAEVPLWRPRPDRMKRKGVNEANMHILPLPRQAVALVRRAMELSTNARDGVHLFPGHQGGRHRGVWKQTHLSRHSTTRAMRQVRQSAKLNRLVPHDFRKAITTWLSERGERADVLDKILHHASGSVTGRHYNFALLVGPIRDAMQRWADHVWAITGQAKADSNVISLAIAR